MALDHGPIQALKTSDTAMTVSEFHISGLWRQKDSVSTRMWSNFLPILLVCGKAEELGFPGGTGKNQ